jgi:hypothetical protein
VLPCLGPSPDRSYAIAFDAKATITIALRTSTHELLHCHPPFASAFLPMPLTRR